jgi:glutamine cyclotransferase
MLAHRILIATVVLAGGALAQLSHKIVNQFPSPHGSSYTMGIAYARGTLWIAAGLGTGAGTIYQVDAYTGAQLLSFTAPAQGLRGLTHDGATLWVSSWNNNTVYQLNDITGQLLNSFQAFVGTGHPDGLAWDGNSLLISDETNQIHWFTPTGTPIRSIAVPASGAFNPRDLGWDGTNVWAGYQTSARIRKHDAGTGAVLVDLPSPSGGFQQGLEWADWHLWTSGGTNATVYQIDVGAPYVELVGTMSFPNSVQFRVTEAQAQVGELAVVLLSASGTTGFPVGNLVVPLTFDVVTQICLSIVPNFVATVDAAGVATTPLFPVPQLPAGVPLWAAAVTLNGANLTAVTDPFRFLTQ